MNIISDFKDACIYLISMTYWTPVLAYDYQELKLQNR